MLGHYKGLILGSILFFSSIAFGEPATFTWTPNTETNISGYRIYGSSQSGNYSEIMYEGMPEVVDGKCKVTIEGPKANTFYVATAFNSDNLESGFSDSAETHPELKGTNAFNGVFLCPDIIN